MFQINGFLKLPGILVLFFTVFCGNVEAQDNQQMLWRLMGGNRYAHEAYDKEGNLEKYREIEISEIVEGTAQLNVLIKLYTYNSYGTVSDTTETILQCNEDGSSMFMNVLVLFGMEGGEVEAQITGSELRYPRNQNLNQSLEDVTLKAKLKSGALASLLGTKVVAVLKERSISAIEADGHEKRSGFAIKEIIQIKFFALGIKFKERSYRNYTAIHPMHGLSEQRLTASDNSYLSLRLLLD